MLAAAALAAVPCFTCMIEVTRQAAAPAAMKSVPPRCKRAGFGVSVVVPAPFHLRLGQVPVFLHDHSQNISALLVITLPG